MTTISFETLEVKDHTYEDVMVEWEFIGEGFSGDYNPEDPDDEPLLRFTVYRWLGYRDGAGEWEQVDDASYCTQVPVTTDRERLRELAAKILVTVREDIREGRSIKGKAAALSWIKP